MVSRNEFSLVCHSVRTGLMLVVGGFGLAAIGCGAKSTKEGFVPAFGTVKLDDKPLQNAEIVFETDKGRSTGRTDCYGKYHAEYSRTLHGVGTGTARVKISTKVIFPDENLADYQFDPKTGEHSKPELVPPKYNTKTELKVEIKDGGAPYDFALDSKDSK
ncbi:hypothetical protein [Schlesneria paludicola]|uniref:hypothetical protein n=1 Tax=Schlesneria paludicola TaxID=360056 RepID=UPI00029A0FE5|nr:hypothetical protein [Schlesneria paludicola]